MKGEYILYDPEKTKYDDNDITEESKDVNGSLRIKDISSANPQLIVEPEVMKNVSINIDPLKDNIKYILNMKFYWLICKCVEANLKKEYYDYIVAGFRENRKLNTEQLQDIEQWQQYRIAEKKAKKEAKIFLRKYRSVLSTLCGNTKFSVNAIFDLAFIRVKKERHLKKINKIVTDYKACGNVEKYEQGLRLLRIIDDEYNAKIAEAQKKVTDM